MHTQKRSVETEAHPVRSYPFGTLMRLRVASFVARDAAPSLIQVQKLVGILDDYLPERNGMRSYSSLSALLSIAFLTLTGTAFGQTALDQLVPADRQVALGFDKLSFQQRNEIAGLLEQVYEIGKREGSQGVVSVPVTSVVETQIDGEFSGWEGETVFKLMNGQIWQQTDYQYHYRYAYMPGVLIYPSGGDFKMKVEGIDQVVGVKRIR